MEPQAAPLMAGHCRKSLLQEKRYIQVIFPHARYIFYHHYKTILINIEMKKIIFLSILSMLCCGASCQSYS